MNLLNNVFNSDDIKIKETNKLYFFLSVGIFLLIIVLLIIKKDNYCIGSYSIIDNSIVLLVNKDNINDIQKINEITIGNIANNYSINSITSVNDNYLVNISLKTEIKNIIDGEYRIYLGKERLFDYIVRIIKK